MKENDIRESALFKINITGKEILSSSENVKDYLRLRFLSVTTDQPVYWPDEEVFLKVLMPLHPGEHLAVTLKKKDAAPFKPFDCSTNDGGILVHKIMSGKNKKLQPGEYRVEVRNEKGNLFSSASFTVVEGALGALSFAYEFKKVTKPEELEKVKGGWFLGNASGIGKRWGNGLNVKNEIRVLNKPYNGKATIMSRCYLSGCNGCEAGPPFETEIKDGLLQGVLAVGGHSGPFEIEVVTKEGALRYLFEKSGHIERQNIQISSNVSKKFYATLSPYEGTDEVYGRDVYIFNEKSENTDDPLELESPVFHEPGEIILKVKKAVKNPRIFVYYPVKDDFQYKEVKLEQEMKKGETIKVMGFSPYSFIAIGGFQGEKDAYYEAWVIAFTESSLDIDITSPESGSPLSPCTVEVLSKNRHTGKEISIYGILEVFDNRVASKSGKDPLSSAVGDSFRELSQYVSSWYDSTGLFSDERADDFAGAELEEEMDMGPLKVRMSEKKSMFSFRKISPKKMGKKTSRKPGKSIDGMEKPDQAVEQEEIREGEKKVIFCDVIRTGTHGRAKADITLPPQTGRCHIRFTAINQFDYLDKIKAIDVAKSTSVEVSLLPMLIPDSKVIVKASVVNLGEEPVILRIYGAGVKQGREEKIEPGEREVEFTLHGSDYGGLYLELVDKDNNIKDKREITLKNIASYPVAFSNLIISDGNEITIDPGKKIALYAHPGYLLSGIIANIETTIYSWFGHCEAVSAETAILSVLLASIEEHLLDDEGKRDTLKAHLIKAVKDLYEVFYNKNSGLFYPYPGIKENVTWSAWVYKHLSVMLKYLESSGSLKQEFSKTMDQAKEMQTNCLARLKKENMNVKEIIHIDPENNNSEVIPVEVQGSVIYKAITDDAVVQWFTGKMAKALDVKADKATINAQFVKAYDTYRFLRAFERTGVLYYLLLNAKSLFLKNDSSFFTLFDAVANGLILTGEPGLIQGPALLGGVYSAPQTLVVFLELLLLMAKSDKLKPEAKVTVKQDGKSTEYMITGKPEVIESTDRDTTIVAPPYVTVREDMEKTIQLYHYLESECFFALKKYPKKLGTGQQADIIIELDNDKDPLEYYAIIALPSVFSLLRTDDLLADYKGNLLYGTKAHGGEKIQLLTVPFRGLRKMTIVVEAVQRGVSAGYVLVRHVSNPDIIATLKLPEVEVAE